MTASNAYEYAFEQDSLSLDAPVASLFTDVLIEGLTPIDPGVRVLIAELVVVLTLPRLLDVVQRPDRVYPVYGLHYAV
mgnify:CR=1 FL=1